MLQAFARKFEGRYGAPELVAAQGSGLSIREQCRLAESSGAKFLLVSEVVENRIAYKGPRGVAWAWDVFCLLMFTPFHIFVADEVFEARRSIECFVYDVRDPESPVYQFSARGQVESPLHELEHGYVLLHPIRRFWSDWRIFQPDDWQKVYKLMMPAAQRELMRDLLGRLQGVVAPLLQNFKGVNDPEKSRVYAVLVGQSAPGVKYAANDAKELARALLDAGVVVAEENQQVLIDQPAEAVLAAVRDLRTRVRPVDRVLVYVSAKGRRKGDSAELLCQDSTLTLTALGRAGDELDADSVLYLLETSFGDGARGEGKGGRTAEGSESRAAPIGQALINKPGRQLLLAAAPDKVTGEYRGHGLLTGFLLEGLKPASSELSLNLLLQDTVRERYRRRSRGLLGVAADIYRRFHGDVERDFLLRRPEKTQVADKGGR